MGIADEIHLHPAPYSLTTRRTLVFFLTGNPGLIEYYRTFLTHLYDLLRIQDSRNDLHIYGASLTGFEVGHNPSKPTWEGKVLPLNLDEQIDSTFARLTTVVDQINESSDGKDEPLPVVLVGHSVGAYMLLEIIARWQRMQDAVQDGWQLKIVGGICLFPTVVDIAQSPTGRKMAPLLALPGFALIVHLIAKILLAFVPFVLLNRLVQLITLMPLGAAKTTAAFLKSKHGVRQALYMAKHEMLQMTHDRWSDDLWGAGPVPKAASAILTDSNVTRRPKLYFYWARNDHWVANTTRNHLIKTRGRKARNSGSPPSSPGDENKPLMEIDKHGIPHGFCIKDKHSETVAGKVAGYVMEIANSLR